MKINQTYKNNHLTVELISLHQTDLETLSNVAILRRLNDYKQTIDFIVVCNFTTNNNECSWAFAYAYDLPNLEQATELFVEKIS